MRIRQLQRKKAKLVYVAIKLKNTQRERRKKSYAYLSIQTFVFLLYVQCALCSAQKKGERKCKRKSIIRKSWWFLLEQQVKLDSAELLLKYSMVDCSERWACAVRAIYYHFYSVQFFDEIFKKIQSSSKVKSDLDCE